MSCQSAYCSDEATRISLSSTSLPCRNHQSLRLVVFSFFLELSRRLRNVSDAWRPPHLRNRYQSTAFSSLGGSRRYLIPFLISHYPDLVELIFAFPALQYQTRRFTSLFPFYTLGNEEPDVSIVSVLEHEHIWFRWINSLYNVRACRKNSAWNAKVKRNPYHNPVTTLRLRGR